MRPDGFIGFGHGPLHGLAGIIIRGQALLHDPRDDLRGQAARLFAAVLPAHAVGHEKKVVGAVDDVAVFVVLPDPLGRVATDTQNVLSHALAPIQRTSNSLVARTFFSFSF